MPDQEGKIEGAGVKDTPDQAYKSGRPQDVQEGSLGADTGGSGEQKSRLPEASDETGTAHAGGFAGQDADDSPDAGTVGEIADSGDPSPHAQHDEFDQDSPTDVGEGAKNPAPGTLGTDGADEVGQRGIGQQPDVDADDPDSREAHPKTPS